MTTKPIFINTIDEYVKIPTIMKKLKLLINMADTEKFKKQSIKNYKTILNSPEYKQSYYKIVSSVKHEYPDVDGGYRQLILDEIKQAFDRDIEKRIGIFEEFLNDCYYGNIKNI
jgi:hypothetical protein